MALDDDAPHVVVGEHPITGELDALDELERPQLIQQRHTAGAWVGVDRNVAVATEAEEMRQALTDLAHRERLAGGRFHQLANGGVVNRDPICGELDLDHTLADEFVDLRPGRRRARPEDETGTDRAGPVHGVTREQHQKACLTRKSSA